MPRGGKIDTSMNYLYDVDCTFPEERFSSLKKDILKIIPDKDLPMKDIAQIITAYRYNDIYIFLSVKQEDEDYMLNNINKYASSLLGLLDEKKLGALHYEISYYLKDKLNRDLEEIKSCLEALKLGCFHAQGTSNDLFYITSHKENKIEAMKSLAKILKDNHILIPSKNRDGKFAKIFRIIMNNANFQSGEYKTRGCPR